MVVVSVCFAAFPLGDGLPLFVLTGTLDSWRDPRASSNLVLWPQGAMRTHGSG